MDGEPQNKHQGFVYDVRDILKILPHRFPFLLVDRVLEVNLEKEEVLALKNVSYNEAFFQGHFPDAPIMPGVLILEALAQVGGILVHVLGKSQGRIAVLLNINNAKFRQPVRPGDALILHAKGIHLSSRAGKIQAEARVGDKVAVEAEISFAQIDKSQI